MTPQAPGTVWITGLPASGKTTLSRELHRRLRDDQDGAVTLVDGESVRARHGGRHGYSLAARFAVLELVVEEARRGRDTGHMVIVATVSPTRAMRAHARAQLPPFFEVFLDCSPDVCAARDPSGQYARARRGELTDFVGVDLSYERPDAAELVLDTAATTVAQASTTLYGAARAFLAAANEPR